MRSGVVVLMIVGALTIAGFAASALRNSPDINSSLTTSSVPKHMPQRGE